MTLRALRIALLAAAVGLAGCTADTLDTGYHGSAKGTGRLSNKVLADMRTKGMTRTSPILARVFKEEAKLEIWKQKTNGRYDLIASYDICKMSGKLGPKFTEGDRQSPEGFYTVRPTQLNPNSNYHLAFNIGYPNAYDRAHGRTGSNLMVHGGCSSSGCFSMTDTQIEEIYAFARAAFEGGQTDFQVQSFPFRMTAANMARYRDDPNYAFWTMLKEGYDHFEITKVPPKVDVCEKRYAFNRIPEGGGTFSPTGACPASTQPASLTTAYLSYQANFDAAFASATAGSTPAARPSINGIQEAKIVSDWTKKRARGERVPMEPPSMSHDGSVRVTSQMGRIDSPAGRKMAAIDAEKAAKKKAEEEKARAIAAAKAAKEAEKAAALAAAQAPVVEAAPPAEAAVEDGKPPIAAGLRKRIKNIFGT